MWTIVAIVLLISSFINSDHAMLQSSAIFAIASAINNVRIISK